MDVAVERMYCQPLSDSNRIIKIVGGYVEGSIRDAHGNILAVYSYDGTSLKWSEQDLYGSSRIGILNWDEAIPDRVMLPQNETDTLSDWYLLGSRDYELSNHLGNVLSVITDKKVGVSSGGSVVDYYRAEVLSQNDYYPFGMTQPGRQFQLNSYRYGFNGKEKDNEISGEGNSYDYGMRFYDARAGRFYSVDPLTGKYPWNSPYAFAENRVIDGIDLEGLEFYSVHINEAPDGTRTLIGVINYSNVKRKGMTNISTENGYGLQGDVGVNYTISKVDDKGKVISRSGFNVKNYYGVYNGPHNPKEYWEKPDSKGNYQDDYSLPPIDEEDKNGFLHDKDYDKLHLRGLSGVLDARSTPANEAYRKRAAKIVEKYKKRENDDVTGKPVTKKAATAAHKYAEEGIKSFKTAEELKHIKIESGRP